MKKFKRSVVIPLCLLVYLALMAYLGRERLAAGEYLHYFGVIGGGIVIIVLLHILLKKKEQIRERNERTNYGTYEDDKPEDGEKA